ncbi:LiaF domain-containing protein [Corynebacterium mendelii]|uniref:Cell wall-active antibiotics response LiaF-like C-terminal domain-containing protein n=1 Tax=Corynebacterium mendelii TaxID=2765362 RepID=A0A939E240_9CORY|nr:LiaF domain-containing protein [Corynebacterium mendelii]MBN9644266.1 hypothetical protein [Corynebacterium mendelii]
MASTGAPQPTNEPLPADSPVRHRAQQLAVDAVGDGRITLGQFDDITKVIWAVDATAGDLQRVTAPVGPVTGAADTGARQPVAQSSFFSLMGDIIRSGEFTLAPHTSLTLIMGDVILDLTRARITADVSEITVLTVMGDVRVTIPETIGVEISGFGLLGDTTGKTFTPRPGSPTVKITVRSLLGDTTVTTEPARY